MYEYIQRLDLSLEDKQLLTNLGASSKEALVGLIHAVPHEVSLHLGEELFKSITTQLGLKNIVFDPIVPNSLGALVDLPAPQLKEPNYSIEKRDQLFNYLQQLKSQSSPSLETKTKILALEKEINDLLEQ